MEQCGVAPGACDAPTPEDCADDDCDGQIDEGLSCACTPEVCNGRDDDCNNVVDDVPAGSCGLNIGICRPGTTRCVPDGMGGASAVCDGATGPRAEDCNGADDNCNGIVDDVASRVCYPMGFLGCTYNAGTGNYDCRGQCQPGLQACVMASWDQSACSGAITPLAEVPCDQRDNNCDGLVDENDPTPNDQCYPAAVAGCTRSGNSWTCVGECKTGQLACDVNTGAPGCNNPITPFGRGLRRQGQRLRRHDRRGLRRRRRLRQRGDRPLPQDRQEDLQLRRHRHRLQRRRDHPGRRGVRRRGQRLRR